MMKYTLLLATIAALVPGYWSACKSIEELDQCALDFSFFADRGLATPNNDDDVIAYCNKAKGGINCLLDQAKECMKGPFKSVTIKVMGDVLKQFQTRCDSPDHRADFLRHISCFQDSSKGDAVRLCSDKYMVMLEKILTVPKEQKLGGICCSSHALRDCVIGQINTLCSGESGDYFNEMIDEVVEENMEMMCQQYTNLNACESKYDPATWADLKAIMDSTDAAQLVKQHQYKTFVPIILKMLKDNKK